MRQFFRYGILASSVLLFCTHSSAALATPTATWTSAEDAPASGVNETIVVTHANQAPVVIPQTVYVGQNSSILVTLNGTDVENDPLTFRVTSPPQFGTLGRVAGNSVTYTPAANYSGDDSFGFVANDGTADSAAATVSILVTTPPLFSTAPTLAPNPVIVGFPVSGSATVFALHGTAGVTWDFGDGTPQAGGTDVTHTYVNSGRFTVTVTATSPEGQSTVYSTSLSVSLGLSGKVPPGAIDPGVYGFLVGGVGITKNDKAMLTVNYIKKKKTSFNAAISGIAFPPGLTPASFANQIAVLSIGAATSQEQEYILTIDSKGKAKAPGMPSFRIAPAKDTLSFKVSSRAALTDLVSRLQDTATSLANGDEKLNVPVALQIGATVYLAFTVQLDYKANKKATSGKGRLLVVK